MIKTLKALSKRLSQEKYDLSGYKLIAEDAETCGVFNVENIELDPEVKQAVIVVRKKAAVTRKDDR
jgi:hypothetical protein